MFVLNITKKKSRALLFSVVPFRDIPLNQLQSLCDRNPRGITFGYATRDHCFVIASEGVKKKSLLALFFYSHSIVALGFGDMS